MRSAKNGSSSCVGTLTRSGQSPVISTSLPPMNADSSNVHYPLIKIHSKHSALVHRQRQFIQSTVIELITRPTKLMKFKWGVIRGISSSCADMTFKFVKYPLGILVPRVGSIKAVIHPPGRNSPWLPLMSCFQLPDLTRCARSGRHRPTCAGADFESGSLGHNNR